MSDLISRSALLGAFREYMIERFDRERCSSEENCKVCDRPCLWIRKVGEAPAVDAVPVVHGRWIEHLEFGYDGSCIGVVYKCSVCNDYQGDVDYFYFCPNCGAKMDGEKDG